MPPVKKPSENAKSAPAARFDVTAVRRRFPALRQKIDGVQPAYLDNPGGTQVSDFVLKAMRTYLVEANANTHGDFHTSRLTDETIAGARRAMADLLNAPSPDDIVFGPNMTTLTFGISRAIGKTLGKGSEIVVTRMDHDANISPWLLIARDYGFKIKWAEFDPKTGRLDYEQMQKLIGDRTKVVACVYASNALGTINDVLRVVEMAHAAGALAYIDAVQYAPHGPIDVQALDCDFLACSAYKFFGPHMGMVYGKHEHLASLPAYKVRPAPDSVPDRWETGTQNHEGIAGVAAAVDYLAWVGEQFGGPFARQAAGFRGRRKTLKQAMLAIKHHEQSLSRRLLEGLKAIDGVDVVGIANVDHLDERVPTVIFSVKGERPQQVAAALGAAGIYVWDGNYYALAVMEKLGREEHGGMVRVGATHYNTTREIDRFLKALEPIAGKRLKVVTSPDGKRAAKKPAVKKKKTSSPDNILA